MSREILTISTAISMTARMMYMCVNVLQAEITMPQLEEVSQVTLHDVLIVALVIYVLSPVDCMSERSMGARGLIDDLIVIWLLAACFGPCAALRIVISFLAIVFVVVILVILLGDQA